MTIRRRDRDGETVREIARSYNVSHSTISRLSIGHAGAMDFIERGRCAQEAVGHVLAEQPQATITAVERGETGST